MRPSIRVRAGAGAMALAVAAAALTAATSAPAAETIRYKYDARGRLVEVVRTGVGGKPDSKREYQYDRANNRKLRRTMPP